MPLTQTREVPTFSKIPRTTKPARSSSIATCLFQHSAWVQGHSSLLVVPQHPARRGTGRDGRTAKLPARVPTVLDAA